MQLLCNSDLIFLCLGHMTIMKAFHQSLVEVKTHDTCGIFLVLSLGTMSKDRETESEFLEGQALYPIHP